MAMAELILAGVYFTRKRADKAAKPHFKQHRPTERSIHHQQSATDEPNDYRAIARR